MSIETLKLLVKLFSKILISRLSPNQEKHGLNLLKSKDQFNNLRLGQRPKKLELLRVQVKLYKTNSHLLPLKSPTVGVLLTTDFQLLNKECMMLREELRLSSPLLKCKLHSEALHGRMLRLQDKPSLIHKKDISLRRNLTNYSNPSKPTFKLLMSPDSTNEYQLKYLY